jgi:hypothetical protein
VNFPVSTHTVYEVRLDNEMLQLSQNHLKSSVAERKNVGPGRPSGLGDLQTVYELRRHRLVQFRSSRFFLPLMLYFLLFIFHFDLRMNSTAVRFGVCVALKYP